MKWVHCNQHGAPHYLNDDGSCWCGCIKDAPNFGRNGTALEAQTQNEAAEECRKRGLWLYADLEQTETGGTTC